MANKRCIPTRFFQDPDIVDLSRDSQLILIGLVLYADDEGREMAHSKVLGQVIGYTTEQIEQALAELVAHHLVVLYQVGRHRYYSLVQQWQNMGQKMTPSRYPAPPEPSLEELPGISAGNPGTSGEMPETSGDSLGNPAQFNSSEDEEEEPAEPSETLPENVTPFPPPRGDGVSEQETRGRETTKQVARILKLAQSEALSRLVTEYLATPGLSLLGEADAAREWMDDPRRNRKRQRMSPAFFRRWLKREQVAMMEQAKRAQATETSGKQSSAGVSGPEAPPGLSSRNLMNLEAEYRAKRAGGKAP